MFGAGFGFLTSGSDGTAGVLGVLGGPVFLFTMENSTKTQFRNRVVNAF